MKLIIEIDEYYFEIIKHDFENGANYKQNERPNNNFTRKELESWLYQIAFNNTDNELSKNCEEIIKRLDGFERFCADMRGT